MIVVLFASLLAVFFTYLQNKKPNFPGLKIAFIILTFVSAIHCQYGNDYHVYFREFQYFKDDTLALRDLLDMKEPVWYAINVIFGNLFGESGFYVLVAVLSIIQNYLIFRGIKKFVDPQWQWLAVFIFTFHTSFWLLGMSMLRQIFVICMFFGMLELIEQKRVLIAALLIFVAAQIHSSAIVLLPFVFFGFVNYRNRRLMALVYAVTFAVIFVSQTALENMFGSILEMSEKFEEYAESYDDIAKNLTYGLGYTLQMIPFVVVLFHVFKKDNKKSISTSEENQHEVGRYNSIMLAMLLYLVSAIITPFGRLLPLVSRIGLYFSIFGIIVIPYVYPRIKKKLLRIGLFAIYFFITIYGYYVFFSPASVYYKAFGEFHSIFEYI